MKRGKINIDKLLNVIIFVIVLFVTLLMLKKML
jgi:hypothetical protein